jgi:hypothetical protein
MSAKEARKPEDPEKNPCGKLGRESTNNSTHMKYPSRGSMGVPLYIKIMLGVIASFFNLFV